MTDAPTDADTATGGAPARSPAPAGSVRVRFAPAPSGDLHVGNVRTALYNWTHTRHTGGTFVLRIEDTDPARVTEEAYRGTLDALRWLGLAWDEGPDVGGPYGPYRQSARMDIYAEWSKRLLDQGDAYRCYCTPAELEARREAARERGEPTGYDGYCRNLSPEQVAAYEAEGRAPAIRFRMPAGVTTFTDTLRGEVTIEHAHVPDFVLVRGDGRPLYTLCVAVDDVLMKITHIIRGEDLLSSTPRQLAVYRAMGVAEEDWPRLTHLPPVLGHDGAPLSKRHGEVSISGYREQGFLPEAMANYLALLGWSPGGDREEFTLDEMAQDFAVDRVNRNAAQFDPKKLEAFNGTKIRRLDVADLAARIQPFLREAGLVGDPPTAEQRRLVEGVAPLVQPRVGRLTEVPGMAGFLFVAEEDFAVEPETAHKSLTREARQPLAEALAALETVEHWGAEPIERALRGALVDGLGLKPRSAFTPVRAAVTGRRVSPPLFESVALLGRERALGRLRAALDSLPAE